MRKALIFRQFGFYHNRQANRKQTSISSFYFHDINIVAGSNACYAGEVEFFNLLSKYKTFDVF